MNSVTRLLRRVEIDFRRGITDIYESPQECPPMGHF